MVPELYSPADWNWIKDYEYEGFIISTYSLSLENKYIHRKYFLAIFYFYCNLLGPNYII